MNEQLQMLQEEMNNLKVRLLDTQDQVIISQKNLQAFAGAVIQAAGLEFPEDSQITLDAIIDGLKAKTEEPVKE